MTPGEDTLTGMPLFPLTLVALNVRPLVVTLRKIVPDIVVPLRNRPMHGLIVLIPLTQGRPSRVVKLLVTVRGVPCNVPVSVNVGNVMLLRLAHPGILSNRHIRLQAKRLDISPRTLLVITPPQLTPPRLPTTRSRSLIWRTDYPLLSRHCKLVTMTKKVFTSFR